LGVVVLLHLLAFWAIQAGLARDIGRQLPQVVQAILLQETPPPPPPKIAPPPAPQPPPPQPQAPPPVAPEPPPPPPATPSPAFVPQKEAPAAEIPTTTSPTANSIAEIPTTNLQPASTTTGKAPSPSPSPSPPPATSAKVKSEPVRTGPIGIYCEKPSFPSISRRMEEAGAVTLNIFVSIEGNVSKINIEKSSGYKRLDEAAKSESMRWRFKPATLDGKPIEHSFMKTFNFKLDSDSISNQSPKEKDNPPC
jgi:protein TonB